MKWFRRNRRPDAAAPVAVRGALELRRPWIRPSVKGRAEAGAFLVIDNKGMEQDPLGLYLVRGDSVCVAAVGRELVPPPQLAGAAMSAAPS